MAGFEPPYTDEQNPKFFMRQIEEAQDVQPQRVPEYQIPNAWDTPQKNTDGAVTAS